MSRGIETWALDTATALATHEIDATLFAAAALPLRRARAACSPAVALAKLGRVSILRCLQRNGRVARALTRAAPGWAWRWGLKSAYGWEQLSFWLHLWPRLRRGGFDILHVQDPMVADWCRRFRRARLVRTKEILAHGTEETDAFLQRFDHVQHLAPWHLANAECKAGDRKWTVIPNFVDTEVFRPAAGDDEKRTCRARFGIPADAFVVGTVAAVKKHHKRIDYLIREFAGFVSAGDVSRIPDLASRIFLVVAGARQDETDELIALARSLCRGRIKILLDVQREHMPDLYRCLDLFAVTSLFEMMPIAVLEALASGVAAVANGHPVLQWMIGTKDRGRDPANGQGGVPGSASRAPRSESCGGWVIDMAADCELSGFLSRLDATAIQGQAVGARHRALDMFSREVVIVQCVDYYRRILEQEDRRVNGG